jgi:DmsE family decaheme c-type cytochrome
MRIRIGLSWSVAVGVFGLFSAAAYSQETSSSERTYLGQEVCVACHRNENDHWSHTVHAKVFLTNPSNDMAAKGCESCHGPGSEHITDVLSKSKIISFTRDSGYSPIEQNAICMTCHAGRERIHWRGSPHQSNDLACADCHNPMASLSDSGLLRKEAIHDTCFGCHQKQRLEFRKRSHMPLFEGKVSCSDCHNPHGSAADSLLKADTVNKLCYQCHAEKRGPFIFSHAPVRESCLNCHSPHGSNHEMLLTTARPFLCQQCHTSRGHPNELLTRANLPGSVSPDVRLLNRGCQNCHTQIHGSNHPSGVRLHR